MTWEIFIGITVLIGFIITVITPVMKLAKIMTELSMSVKALEGAIMKLDDKNAESHSRIWKQIEVQDDKVDDHEKRITKIECQFDIKKHD